MRRCPSLPFPSLGLFAASATSAVEFREEKKSRWILSCTEKVAMTQFCVCGHNTKKARAAFPSCDTCLLLCLHFCISCVFFWGPRLGAKSQNPSISVRPRRLRIDRMRKRNAASGAAAAMYIICGTNVSSGGAIVTTETYSWRSYLLVVVHRPLVGGQEFVCSRIRCREWVFITQSDIPFTSEPITRPQQ